MPPRPRRAVHGAAGLALCLTLTAASAAAQDVTLSARDGGLSLEGTLLAYDGAHYRVQTAFGPLTLAADGVLCEGPGCPDLTAPVAEIAIAGAPGPAARLLPVLIADYAAAEGLSARREGALVRLTDAEGADQTRLRLQRAPSDTGLLALMAGTADLALSVAELRDASVVARVVALDAFVPVLGRGNPVADIGLDDLTAVLSGKVDNWAELGWLDAPIALHALAADSAVQMALEAALLAPDDLGHAPATRHADAAALIAAVAADPFALGVALWSEVSAAPRPPARPALTDGCGLVLEATPLAIKAEDYPLTLPLLLHLRAGRQPLALRRLAAHMTGPAAQAAIRAAGFVDQAPEALPLQAQGNRLASAVLAADPEMGLEGLQRLVRALQGTERLSTTFRFEPGTADLDVASRGNVTLLARALEAGLHDGRTLVFAGFTDGQGGFALNRRLSQERAEAVRDAVRAAAPLIAADRVTLEAEGFGPAMPMACDDTDAGRRINRRVEVWLR